MRMPVDDELTRAARNSLGRLLGWIEAAPLVTPDPIDIKGHPWFLRRLATRDRFFSRWALKMAYVAVGLFPRGTRRLLRIPQHQTCGAAAWLVRAYLELFRHTGDADHLRTAEVWLSRLKEMRLNSYEEWCWDWPFDWQSKLLIPAHIPFVYDSCLAGQAFLEHFLCTGEKASLEVVLSACRGILSIFNRIVDNERHLCLSYSTIDRMQVPNVNALAGGMLCQVGRIVNQPQILDGGQRMLNWLADVQLADGSWGYILPDEAAQDHYHAAMTLQGLLEGSDAIGQGKWIGNLERGIRFYLGKMFGPEGLPKYTPVSAYPIDAMNCAEGLILFSRLQSFDALPASLRAQARECYDRLLKWACRRMQSPQGDFYYFLYYPGIRLKLGSHRWGQGAMLKALACFLNRDGVGARAAARKDVDLNSASRAPTQLPSGSARL